MTNEPVWTEWLPNPGTGQCPVPKWAVNAEALTNQGGLLDDVHYRDWGFPYGYAKEPWDITHYRYAVPADLAHVAAISEQDERTYRGLQFGVSYNLRDVDRARRDLGYENMDRESLGPELGEPDPLADEKGAKPDRYRDRNGDDWIDEFARTSTPEEFRGAMRFTIGKYNRRAGKKDELIIEIRKMRDYCDRWLEYEGGVRNELLSA